MTTDSHLQLVHTAPARRPAALPAQPAHRPPASHEISARISAVEQEITRLSAAFAAAQEQLGVCVEPLQQQMLRLLADRLRRSCQLPAPALSARHAEHGFAQSDTDLERQLADVTTLQEAQQQRLARLHGRLALLARLHDYLRRASFGQEQGAAALASCQRRLRLHRVHVDGLQGLYHRQQQALSALQADHALLQQDLLQRGAARPELCSPTSGTRPLHPFWARAVWTTLAAGVLSLAGTLYHQQSSPKPKVIEQQIAGLSAELAQQAQDRLALQAGLEEQQSALQAALVRLDAQQGRAESLGADAQKAAAELERMDADIAALQAAVTRLRAATVGQPAAAAADAGIAMPIALPGLRPTL